MEEEEERGEEEETEILVKAVMKCPFCEFEDKSGLDLEAHVNTHFPSNVLQSELFKNVVKDTLAKHVAS